MLFSQARSAMRGHFSDFRSVGGRVRWTSSTLMWMRGVSAAAVMAAVVTVAVVTVAVGR